MSLFTLESSGKGSVDEITSDTVCDKHYLVLITLRLKVRTVVWRSQVSSKVP